MTKAEHVAAAREAVEEAEAIQRYPPRNGPPPPLASVSTLLTTAVRELVAALATDNEDSEALPKIKPAGRLADRSPGLYVVMTAPPGPDSEFVELEDEKGCGVGPAKSGAEWREEGIYWTLGPFAPVEEKAAEPYVTIHARQGVTADEIKRWLEENFQRPMAEDRGRNAMDPATLRGGNPLVNARIKVKGHE